MRLPIRPEDSPRGARALSGGSLVHSAPCPVCEKPLLGRQKFCSAKCRATWSREQRARDRAERDSKVRLLLTTAMEAVHEARAQLGK